MINILKSNFEGVEKSYLSIITIIFNSVVMQLLLFASITAILLLNNIYRKSQIQFDMKRNRLISAFLTTSIFFRIVYWILSYWKFTSGSFPSVLKSVFSYISMLFMYLSQSVFMQSWLQNFQRKSSASVSQLIFSVFFILDSIIIIIMLIAILFSLCEHSQAQTALLSKVLNSIIVFSSFITSMSFLFIGLFITKRVSLHLTCCSSQVLKFISTFFVLTIAALFRCVMFLLLIFKKNMDGNLVQISMFFVPEFVPGVLIVGTQISVYKREREYYLEYALETVELLSETVQQYN
ncbi:Hypothetical_protein [Hexamita inflata]|uniref:Hypothetical_protein n=1 Tax=Hexamita inflata TaxID=28002 RepID=A0AA86PIU6_9EUKA|nr:Hypothetical protein HINF_LOCUS28009 [Hexamita inflata]